MLAITTPLGNRPLTLLVQHGRPARHLHAAHQALARRRTRQSADPAFMLSRKFPRISGDMAADGLNRYELDFLETAEWAKDLVLRMRDEVPRLKAASAQHPFEPPSAAYLCFETTEIATHDLTVAPPVVDQARVRLHVPVAQVQPALTPEQRHRLLLLVGDKYDAVTDTIQLESDRFPHSAQNKRWLADAWKQLLEAAVSSKVLSTDLPLDLRHVEAPAGNLEFPSEWVRG